MTERSEIQWAFLMGRRSGRLAGFVTGALVGAALCFGILDRTGMIDYQPTTLEEWHIE